MTGPGMELSGHMRRSGFDSQAAWLRRLKVVERSLRELHVEFLFARDVRLQRRHAHDGVKGCGFCTARTP